MYKPSFNTACEHVGLITASAALSQLLAHQIMSMNHLHGTNCRYRR